MQTQGNTSDLPDIQTVLAAMGTIGAGVLAVLKWLDNRKKSTKDVKVAREDWLIDNAFDIVKGLREELDRLRKQLETESIANQKTVEKLRKELDTAYSMLDECRKILRQNNLPVPVPPSNTSASTNPKKPTENDKK